MAVTARKLSPIRGGNSFSAEHNSGIQRQPAGCSGNSLERWPQAIDPVPPTRDLGAFGKHLFLEPAMVRAKRCAVRRFRAQSQGAGHWRQKGQHPEPFDKPSTNGGDGRLVRHHGLVQPGDTLKSGPTSLPCRNPVGVPAWRACSMLRAHRAAKKAGRPSSFATSPTDESTTSPALTTVLRRCIPVGCLR